MHTVKAKYLIEGMSCSGCERTVQNVISKIKGVTTAKVDLASASATVEYDPSLVTLDNIREAVSRVGYKFTGELPPYGQKPGSDEAIP
jgi:copper chaperone CopZ